jgi:subtilisin family serine protease
MRKLIGVGTALAATVALCPAAQAATTAPVPRPAVLPMVLPSSGDVRAAAAEPARWLVGARPDARTASVAQRFGARRLKVGGAYAVPRARARAFAAALRRAGALTYAEPDSRLQRHSALDANPAAWGRGAVVPPTLAPPAAQVSVGIADDFVDKAHPDVGPQTRWVNTGPGAVLGAHGTEVGSAVSGLANGTGVEGIFPGVPLLSYGLGSDITCADAANGVLTLVDQKALVINLSFGSASECFTLYRAVQAAYGAGALVVAAGGNEFLQGNPPSFPASWPHVLSVAALQESLQPAFFSSANAAIDVAAPGQALPLAVPVSLDTDGTPDGVMLDSGTSFAAPIVAGAAAWLWSARRSLSNGQVADVLRSSAQDVGEPGYDPQTGYGMVNLPRALAARTPADDPLEPNDEITFIDGTSFQQPDPYVWRGFPHRPLRASVDTIEDPVDVYRIQVPARRQARIVLRTTFGDADLFVFGGNARRLGSRPLARSERNGRATDALTLTNATAQPRRFYVAILPASRDTLNSSYSLQFSRRARVG